MVSYSSTPIEPLRATSVSKVVSFDSCHANTHTIQTDCSAWTRKW